MKEQSAHQHYLVRDLIKFALLSTGLLAVMIGLYYYDLSTNYFGELASSIYQQLVR